jgi:hypothetical protein
MNANPRGPQVPSVRYVKASLLDVPFIFDLMYEGAIAGVFSDRFLQRTGVVTLLGYILRGVGLQNFQSKAGGKRYQWMMMVDDAGEQLGFLKISTFDEPQRTCNLELLAIQPGLRKQGLGTAALGYVATQLAEDRVLAVHCTKYAIGMQRLLKRGHFKHNKGFNLAGMEEYYSVPGELSHQ